MSQSRKRIQVQGIVQGVGFRPFVYQLASSLKLTGFVFNSSAGVSIEIEGGEAEIDAFLNTLRSNPPPLAEVTAITVFGSVVQGGSGFSILASREETEGFSLVPPDAGTCDACWARFWGPCQSTVRVSVHKLHPLRAALHHPPRHPLRPRHHHHGFVSDVRRMPGGV